MSETLLIFLRSLAMVALALLVVRLTGVRPLARMTRFDLIITMITALTMGTIALNLVPNLLGGLLALSVWVLIPTGLYLLSLKYKLVRDLIQGRELVLINQGKVMEDQLMTAKLTPEDLLGQLRTKNAFAFADVEFAVLEPTGDLSVLLKKDKQPLTARAAGVQVAMEGAPQTVILDGEILDDALTSLGLNRDWLHQELAQVGLTLDNVFLAQVDAAGQLYVDLFDDQLKTPQPQAKELLYTTLKKCQADCELYALGTKQAQAKHSYTQCAGLLQQTIQDLQPILKK